MIIRLFAKYAAIALLSVMTPVAWGVNVYVSSPTNGYSGSSPIHFAANATSGNPITGWVIYVDSNNVYSSGGSSINTNVNMNQGNHNIVIRAWDSTGAYGSYYGTVNVTGGNGGGGLPNPPSNAVWFNDIQRASGWNWCHDPGCAGGSGQGSYWMAQWQGNPSMSGQSMEFYNSGVWANALWWHKFGGYNWAHNFLWDFWVYVDGNSSWATQALEYDVFQFAGGYSYMMGTQCDKGAGVWDVWDAASGHWVYTGVQCHGFSPNSWHHIQWYITTNSGSHTYNYVTLVVDGNGSAINQTHNARWSGWDQNVGVQWQLDVNATGAGYHEWVDKAKLAIW